MFVDKCKILKVIKLKFAFRITCMVSDDRSLIFAFDDKCIKKFSIVELMAERQEYIHNQQQSLNIIVRCRVFYK